MELESKNSDFLGGVFFRAKHSVIAKYKVAYGSDMPTA